ARMVCLPTGAVVGASCVLFYQSGRRSRHPRVPSTGKASILSCEFLLFSRTNSRELGKPRKTSQIPASVALAKGSVTPNTRCALVNSANDLRQLVDKMELRVPAGDRFQ